MTVPYNFTKNLRPLFHVWSSLATEDESTYHILVSNASLFSTNDNPQYEQENSLSTQHYTLALQHVSSRLSNPAASISDAVLSTVIAFACRDVSTSIIANSCSNSSV